MREHGAGQDSGCEKGKQDGQAGVHNIQGTWSAAVPAALIAPMMATSSAPPGWRITLLAVAAMAIDPTVSRDEKAAVMPVTLDQ